MSSILADEIVFVGLRRKILWFDGKLATDPWFIRLVDSVAQGSPGTSLRNILYALLPHSRYVFEKRGITARDPFIGYAEWRASVQEHEDEIVFNVIRHGTQGNIPQRAAIILDYMYQAGLLQGSSTTMVELGCSAGLLGRAFGRALEVFSASSAQKYFWLSRYPRIDPTHSFSYVGVDKVIPPDDLVPYFMCDEDKHQKVARFMQAYPATGMLLEESMEEYLARLELPDDGLIILVTAFVLYHLADPRQLIRLLLSYVESHKGVHWLDLSRAEIMANLLDVRTRQLIPTHVYLRHNGEPVAHIINGSDDCPDWEYL